MSAWIQGKKRVGPWKVRWREVVEGRIVKRSSPTFTSIGEVEAERDAVNLRLAKIAKLRPRRGSALLPFATVVERWKASGLRDQWLTAFYADSVELTVKAISAAQGWQHTTHVTATAIEAWRATKPRGTARPTAMFKAILRWARATLKQPIDDEVLHLIIPQPKPRPPPAVLTKHQVDAIVAQAFSVGDQYGTAVEHLALFGCRPSDLCRLNVGDWDQSARVLTLQTTKSRTRPSHPIAGPFAAHAAHLDRLAATRPKTAALFLSPKGERWRLDRLGAARELGDWYWWHVTNRLPEVPMDRKPISALKDYAITTLDAAGVDDATKKLFTGHRTLSVYARYKATNAERATAALEQLGAHLATPGGKLGGTSNLRGQKRGQKPPRTPPASKARRGKIRKKPHQTPNHPKRHRA